MKERVCVLMSTYNGQDFIKEQIESILQQQNVEVKLIIRDDGSKDGTLDILCQYYNSGLIEYSSGENLGYAGSFIRLLQDAPECEYYAFSDQDDIWLEDKLYMAIKCLKNQHADKQLYYSNLSIFQNGAVLGMMRHPNTTTDKYRCLNQSICTGCTIVINNSLRKFVLSHLPSIIHVHDLWLFHTAVFLGNFYYDDNSFILYRQHGDNQIGAKFTRAARMKSRIKSLKTLTRQHEKEDEAKLLLESYSPLLSSEDIDIIKKVANYKKNLKNRLSLFADQKYNTSIFDKMRILLGVY